jgi:surface antigen
VSLFLGLEDRARTALATQIAFETARAGKPVLWLCAGGHRDLALLMIMTRFADLELAACS